MEREEILARARIYNQQRQAVEKELEKLLASLMELNNSSVTANELGKGEGLVSIGAGAYVRADLEGNGILMPIGSGYVKEYTLEEARGEIGKRVELTEKAVKRMREELGKIDKEMAKLEGEFRKLEG
ncbi:prefoldin subunit alpha [Candidatus Micrarchaeota archaeon]|nr:prefoldin subunit alpha [Candidatus Micrarchaeota archaeon]